MKIAKCPTCNKSLQYDELKINPGLTFIKCPICKSPVRIKEESETELNTDKGNLKIGMLIVQESEQAKLQTFPLKEGINTIGRKASSSLSSIQVKTTDRYLSRHHFKIEVLTKSNGAVVHVMSNWQNANSTRINQEIVDSDDKLVLKHGDLIETGCTRIKFILLSEIPR
jgi:uncharacterized protein YbaR (Trm112 family)